MASASGERGKGKGRVQFDQDADPTVPQRVPGPDQLRTRWGREKGTVAIIDPFTGEVHELETHRLKDPSDRHDWRWMMDRAAAERAEYKARQAAKLGDLFDRKP